MKNEKFTNFKKVLLLYSLMKKKLILRFMFHLDKMILFHIKLTFIYKLKKLS